MQALLKRFFREESGSGVAQALLVSGSALVIIPTANDVGARLAEVFVKLVKALR